MINFKNLLSTGLIFIFLSNLYSQVISSSPEFPKTNEEVIVRVDISQCENQTLLNYGGDVYAHTGVLTTLSESSSDWPYVNMTWGENSPEYKCRRVSTNIYRITITPCMESCYGISANELVASIALVFRSDNTDRQTEDLFVDVDDDGMIINQIKIIEWSI
jgi:hypothetical protein